ncbi:PAS domain S-box protein [bacterium]|nr:PAS domain S-box protein [candidate division CSSED10-310 bacterium]
MDGMEEICILLDAQLNLMAANTAALQALGCTRSTLTGLTLDILAPHLVESGMKNRYLDVIRTGAPLVMQDVFTFPRAGEMPVSVRAVKINDGLGLRIADRRETRKIHTALKESESVLRSVFEATRDFIFILDNAGRILQVNSAARQHLGYSESELIGRGLDELFTPTFRNLRGQLLAAIGERGHSRAEVHLAGKKGDIIPMDAIVSILPGKNRPKYLIAVLRDISETRRMMAALEEGENRYHCLIEAAPLGIIAIDCHGTVVAVNTKLLEILGSPSIGEVRGKNVFQCHPLQVAGISTDIQTVLEQGETVAAERTHQSPWGKTIKLRYHLAPLRDCGNVVRGVQGIVEDITEREALLAIIEAQQPLVAVGRDLIDISHAMKNLHIALDGGVTMLEESIQHDDPDKTRGLLKSVRRSTLRLYMLLMNILDYACERPVRYTTIRTGELLEEVIAQLNPVAAARNLRLEPLVEAGAEYLHTDPERLHRILLNLGLNAIQSSERNGFIEFSAMHRDAAFWDLPGLYSHGLTAVQVRDSGAGIEPKLLPFIFDLHVSGNGSTGLGLTAVKKLMGEMNGLVLVDSRPGEGTVFTLLFLPPAALKLPATRS